MPNVGDILQLPPGASSLGDDDHHFHLQMTVRAAVTPAAARTPGASPPETLIWGTSQGTEQAAGAEAVTIRPQTTGRHRNPFRRDTHFLPAVLVLTPSPLPERVGYAGPRVAEAQEKLWAELGVGTGDCRAWAGPRRTARASGRAGGREGRRPWSLRGRVMPMKWPTDWPGDRARGGLTYPHGIVLTKHAYSADRAYQVLVPVFPLPAPSSGSRPDVVIPDPSLPWVARLRSPHGVAVLPTLVHSLWDETFIADARYAGPWGDPAAARPSLLDADVVDAETLGAIEQIVVRALGATRPTATDRVAPRASLVTGSAIPRRKP